MSDTIPQSVSIGCRKYVKSRIIINTFNTFNNVANYAHDRGQSIIAEGVETSEEAKVCIAYGADYIQGFYFSRSQRTPGGIEPKKAEAVRAFSASIRKNA